jgi:GTP pyrophosphokinase
MPGDSIAGFITKGKGVTIHRRDCRNLERLAVDSARLIEVEWSQNGDVTSTVKLYIESMDKPGILAGVSALISEAEVNISHLQAMSTHDKRALLEFTLEVKNKNQIVSLVNKISQLDGVLSVRR